MMFTLETVSLTILLIISAFRYLDVEHLESATKEAIKLRLIAFYVILYDYPPKLRKQLMAALDSVFEAERPYEKQCFAPSPVAEETSEKPPKRRRLWRTIRFLHVPVMTAIIASILMLNFDENSEVNRAMQLTRGAAWVWAIFGSWLLALAAPIMLMNFTVMVSVFAFVPAVLALLILELIRKIILVVLNKSTSPRTSPFSYFGGLLSVVVAAVGLIRHLLS